MNKRLRDLRRIAKRYARRVVMSRTGYYRLEHEDRHLPDIVTPATPSCWRSERKLRADLRRAHDH